MFENYDALKEDQHKRMNAFPVAVAFSEEQLQSGLAKLGITKEDAVEIAFGRYIRKSDMDAYMQMREVFKCEVEEGIAADQTGDGFIYDMFVSEMFEHGYGYKRKLDDVLASTYLTMEQIKADSRLKNGFDKAAVYVINNSIC